MLSIQSSVAYGHVGNSAAVFPLQRLGIEVFPVSTVQFAHHTGYGPTRGFALDPEQVHDIILGIEDRGVFGQIDVVLSGYQGSEGIAEVVLDAVARVTSANPDAIFACDPVMGNAATGFFVAPTIPPFLRDRVLPMADILTPNQFELGVLTDSEPHTHAAILAAIDDVRARGPRVVLLTSVERAESAADEIEMIVVDDAGAWSVTTPRLPFHANGSGDVTTALFTAHYRAGGDAAAALQRTAGSVYDLLERTHRDGAEELRLIEAQDSYVQPRATFPVTTLR